MSSKSSTLFFIITFVVLSRITYLKVNMTDQDEARLPKNIVPDHYDLWIKPNFDNFTFEGKVEIDYRKTSDSQSTSKVVLNTNDIKILEGSLKSDGQFDDAKLINTEYQQDAQRTVLHFDKDLPQNGKILLKYSGNLNNINVGFYRTSVTIEGKKLYAGTTKFEPTDARRLLPCWDEPAIKATFSISVNFNSRVVLPSGREIEYIALSNSPILSQSGESNDLTVKFKRSPKMSTYLLALIVGPFEYIEKSDGKRPVRVYTTPGKKELGRFALDAAVKSLQFYEKYFEVDYPLEKMDLIAVPDFNSGAMENWGLVTFRETALLFDPENSSSAVKQRVAIVVIHELAHQWFGNLVTMEWWTHLWLNEGFAAFMEHLCGDNVFPEFQMWPQFVSDAYSLALDLDSMRSSHPIEVPVNHPSEISEIFDTISYKKGASVIRMIYEYVGDEAFRKGMKSYLSKHAYQNTVTEDLWAALEVASQKPVGQMASGWTLQMGYPWLSIETKQLNDSKVELTITQEKFSSDGKMRDDEKSKLWKIPISIMTEANASKALPTKLISDRTSKIVVDATSSHWIKLNPRSVSLYRSAYPDAMWKKFTDAIRNKSLPAVDRLNLQSDYFALALAGKLETAAYLDFLRAFREETDYNVWSSIDDSISRLDPILTGTEYHPQFKSYCKDLYDSVYKKFGWEKGDDEDHLDGLTRTLILNRLVSLEDQSFIDQAKRRFKSHITKEKLIPADLRSAVYKTISRFGDDKEFDGLFEIFRGTDLHEEKNRAAGSLGFTTNPDRLKRVVGFGFSDEIRDQDKIYVFAQMGRSNRDFAWSVFKEKKDIIQEKYQASHLFRAFVKYSTENFASHEKANEIEKFFEENEYPQARRVIKQSLEKVRLSADILARDGKAIKAFLLGLKLVK